MERRPLTRRRALHLAALASVAAATGCSRSAGAPSAAPTPLPSASPLPSRLPSPSPPPALPAVARWLPSPQESVPGLKLAAADAVQALCTRVAGQTTADALAGIQGLLAPGFDEPETLRAFALFSDGVSTGEIVYPQFGGLDPLSTGARSGAAMVVVRRRALDAAGVMTTQVRTVDVRLSLEGDQWLVTSIPSLGGEPVSRPATVSPQAAAVLDSTLIDLPDTARWDIHRGAVSDDLLALLAGTTALGRVAVTVLSTGHPREVFGTDTVSAHTTGRAVDLWQVDGVDVVDDQATGGPVSRLQRFALDSPLVSQVGSPPGTDADGPGRRRSFADLVHEDHLHLAV